MTAVLAHGTTRTPSSSDEKQALGVRFSVLAETADAPTDTGQHELHGEEVVRQKPSPAASNWPVRV